MAAEDRGQMTDDRGCEGVTAVGGSVAWANRYPLSAHRDYLLFDYPGRLPHVEANFAGTCGKRRLSPAEPAERSGARRRKEQRCELEGSIIPTVEPGEAFDHFGLIATRLGGGEDTLQRRLGAFQGGQDLTAQERD